MCICICVFVCVYLYSCICMQIQISKFLKKAEARVRPGSSTPPAESQIDWEYCFLLLLLLLNLHSFLVSCRCDGYKVNFTSLNYLVSSIPIMAKFICLTTGWTTLGLCESKAVPEIQTFQELGFVPVLLNSRNGATKRVSGKRGALRRQQRASFKFKNWFHDRIDLSQSRLTQISIGMGFTSSSQSFPFLIP